MVMSRIKISLLIYLLASFSWASAADRTEPGPNFDPFEESGEIRAADPFGPAPMPAKSQANGVIAQKQRKKRYLDYDYCVVDPFGICPVLCDSDEPLPFAGPFLTAAEFRRWLKTTPEEIVLNNDYGCWYFPSLYFEGEDISFVEIRRLSEER
jgi:hypothetical protein